MSEPFWKTKTLAEMSRAEWESLCDGCGRCCLNKLIEDGTDRTYYTDVGCRLLDGQSCRCKDYSNRSALVNMSKRSRIISAIGRCSGRPTRAGRTVRWSTNIGSWVSIARFSTRS